MLEALQTQRFGKQLIQTQGQRLKRRAGGVGSESGLIPPALDHDRHFRIVAIDVKIVS